ncbi:tetratricopeptide repeat protein [Algoriphagus boritolerans]|uniref:TPR repeat-containing protein n=1 Tax=Algoriphagus boritolerans DSM 17298 = JCM 18970 TaxID=1120964 RepID=A0A1H5Z1K0_9BACT|nr:tetratricopeptide repeat protein [Algoriphagus boritolerans]SEG29930.1 TPR repeat-containing protein [Algoriphagus boritolerans DSM 17298 = JCM 18970]
MKLLPKVLIVSVFAGTIWACSETKKDPADVYFERAEYERAVQTYTENLNLKPTDVTLLYNRGRAFQEMGDLNKAKIDFESALAYDPNNFQILLSLAAVQLEEKNYASALLYATKAEEIAGAPAMASFLKGRALHQLGLPEDALKAYGNAIQIDKEFGQAYLNRGLLKVALDRKKQACEDFRLAVVLEYPGAPESFDKYCR